MQENKFFKILASIPVILIVLYFIPFLGICLLIFRYFIYSYKQKMFTPIYLISCGFIVLIPKLISYVVDLKNIDYIKDIINSNVYNINFINYSKRLITIGVLALIISYVVKIIYSKISNKLGTEFRNYIEKTEKRNAEIARKNDLEIKQKQEKAKNTNYVKCKYCGSDNLLSDKFGKCKFCRRDIENKNYNPK